LQPLTSQKKNRQEKKFIEARNKCTEINSEEQLLKIQRIKRIIDEEKKLAEIKLQKENNLLIHDQLVQKLTIEHIKQIHELELREAQAKVKLCELRLQRKNEKYTIKKRKITKNNTNEK